MKKVFAGLFIMMMGLFFVACSGGADLKGIIDKAKAEGANWTEAQWKDAYKDATKALKPMMEEAAAMGKKIQEAMTKGDENAAKSIMEDAQKMQEKFKPVEDQMKELETIAKGTEVGKKVFEDEAFAAEVAKELGIDELMKDM